MEETERRESWAGGDELCKWLAWLWASSELSHTPFLAPGRLSGPGSFSAKMCYFYFGMLIEHGPEGCWSKLWVIPKSFPPISSNKHVPCSCLPGKMAPTSSLKPLPTPRATRDLSAARPLMCVIMWYITASQMWLWAPWVRGLILMCVCVCGDWWGWCVCRGGGSCYCSAGLTHRAYTLFLYSGIWNHQARIWEPTAAVTAVKPIGEMRSPPLGSWPTTSAQSTHLTNHLPDPLP